MLRPCGSRPWAPCESEGSVRQTFHMETIALAKADDGGGTRDGYPTMAFCQGSGPRVKPRELPVGAKWCSGCVKVWEGIHERGWKPRAGGADAR